MRKGPLVAQRKTEKNTFEFSILEFGLFFALFLTLRHKIAGNSTNLGHRDTHFPVLTI